VRLELLGRYSRLQSPVHRTKASAKLLLALAAVLAVVLTPVGSAWPLAAVALVLLAAAALSRIPPAQLGKRVLLLEPFALGVAALSVLQPHGAAVFLTVLAKSTLCLCAMVLFSAVTPFSDLLQLMRRARVPALMVTVLALMYRYLSVLLDEADRLKRARASRTFVRRRWLAWTSLASVAAQLFVRSSERGERIYAAMRARGWR
jgi:cobalt/nickel transport system permease protein